MIAVSPDRVYWGVEQTAVGSIKVPVGNTNILVTIFAHIFRTASEKIAKSGNQRLMRYGKKNL